MMDPLSQILSLLKPRHFMSGGMDFAGEWALGFGRYHGIKCYAVIAGTCWLAVEGTGAPMRLVEGDCFILAGGRPFRLASDPGLPPVDALSIFSAGSPDGIVRLNGGGDAFLAGGHFLLDRSHGEILLGAIPPVVHLCSEDDKATLRWSLDQMRAELTERRPGGSIIAQQLAYMVLVLALRRHLSDAASLSTGWLRALSDRQMCAAIVAMHDAPGQRWTLRDLATQVGMSRTVFATRFKAMVGMSAMDYLARWRMLVATDRLETTNDPIAAVALSVGYESESAFGKTFKKVYGCSPRQHSRNRASSDREARPRDVPAIPIAAE